MKVAQGVEGRSAAGKQISGFGVAGQLFFNATVSAGNLRCQKATSGGGWGGRFLRGVFTGCREGLGAGHEVGGLRFDFGLGSLGAWQLDFHCAVGVDFAQENGSPRRHLDVADVHAIEDDWEANGGQEEDLLGPKLRLFGDFSHVQRGRWDEGSRRGGL